MKKKQDLESLLEEVETLKEERMRQLDLVGAKVAKLRNEAVEARQSSGIETVWKEDEEFYEGIDDLNRGEDTLLKPRSSTGGLIARRDQSDNRCTAFFNITRQFVDSAAARAGDILLPSNDWNFTIKHTPVPELDSAKNDDQIAEEKLKEIGERTEKAETRIKDWLAECGYKSEYRKMLESAARLGSGILKGPAPIKQTARKYEGGAFIMQEKIVPASKHVSVWDFFPDPNCGDNIHDGSYVIERDFMSARQLRNLKGMDYIDEAIDRVLKEGPGKSNLVGASHREAQDNDRYEVWYFYGDVKVRDLELMDESFINEESDEDDVIPAVIVMVNDTVIKGYLNPLESSEFPFDLMVWQRREGSPWGIGVARQGRTAQKMVLSATRALMDNMGLSAVPMLAMMRSALQPADGNWMLSPGKLWFIKPESGVRSVQEAIQSVTVPTMQEELTNIIQLGMKMMEDATGVSFLLQGQQGSAPDTVGGMQLLHQNASALLRRIARNGDEVTISHITRYYDWLLMHGEDDSEKGDMMIQAVGSTALVEREIQSMQLPQILQLSLDPRFKKSPPKVFDEILKSWRFDPSKFDMDEEEIAELEQQMQNQPTAPQIEAARIRAEADLQKEQLRQSASVQKMQVDMDRDRVFSEGVTERNRMAYEKNIADTQLRIQEMQLKKELAMLQYANQHQVTLDQIKADLARDAMKINLQRELAMNATHEAEQIITPPSEPAGRAPQGQAFQR